MIPHSEDDILALLDAHFPRSGRGLLLGRGDDCALLAPEAQPRALTCDIFAEDAHFRTRYFSPYDLGWKSLAVNVSDLASAGAVPEAFALGLTLKGGEDVRWLDSCFSGMADLASRWHMALAGGDLSRSALLHFSITAWGVVEHGDLRRGRARAGDMLFVYGETRSGARRSVCSGRSGNAGGPRSCPPALPGSLRGPSAAGTEGGIWIGAGGTGGKGRRVGSRRTDGSFRRLARDLPRLLNSAASGLGADITLPAEALHAEVRAFAEDRGEDAESFAFRGGEDYTLLGSCPPSLLASVEKLGARILGEIRPGALKLNGTPWTSPGFDHFA